MIKKCLGCGSTLQYSDESLPGYTPKKDSKICQRCFKLKNYNEKVMTKLSYDNDDIINILNEKADRVFFITDFISLSKKVIDLFNKVNKEKYLVINKTDFIPKSINKEKYVAWIKDEYQVKENIILLSAIKKYNLNELNNRVKECKNSYICGYTNSGKSTIINELCNLNGKTSNILSSLMPNTTLDVIKVSLDKENWIYDTPGFIIETDFNEDCYPKNYLKPITIQTKENDIININNMFYIETDEIVNSFTFYVSDKLNIKKEYKYNRSDDYKEYSVDDNSELYLENIGFINIKKKAKIKIYLFNGYTEVRHSSF